VTLRKLSLRNIALIRPGIAVFCTLLAAPWALAAESWQSALAKMPLGGKVEELNRSNCVSVMLGAFQSSDAVKALVFMPGATDEFYMFKRAKARLTMGSPTLLDAVEALTNQTLIRVTFRPPLLLLHTDEDPLEPVIRLRHEPTVRKLQRILFPQHVLYNDRDWDHLQPILKKTFRVDVRPWRDAYDSWHFYRHSFAGWGLSGWEGLEAVALAGKTCFTVERGRLVFEGDERVRATPKLDAFPR